MDEAKYTAELWWDSTTRHRSYEAPSSWTPGQIHAALKSAGFRPFFGSDGAFGGSPVKVVTLLRVPSARMPRTPSDEMGYVSGIEPGPCAYFLPGADSEQTEAALVASGFEFGWEARLVPSPG